MRLPLAGRARAVVVLLGWLAAAAVGGLVAVMAIEAVGEGLVGSSTTPLTEDQVDSDLAAQQARTTTAPSTTSPAGEPSTTSASPTTAPTGPDPTTEPPPKGESRSIPTPGGVVIARCDGASPVVMSATPAQGYYQDEDDDDHHEGQARVDFESDEGRVRVEISCVDGVPEYTLDD